MVKAGYTGGTVKVRLDKPSNVELSSHGNELVGNGVPNTRVSSPGNRAELFNSFESTAKLPLVCRIDPWSERLLYCNKNRKVSFDAGREAISE